MIKQILLWWALVFTAAAGAQTNPHLKIAVIPGNPRPGEPVTVALAGGAGVQAVLIGPKGERLSGAAFFNLSQNKSGAMVQAAILAVPCTAPAGGALIQAEDCNGSIGAVKLVITSREFAAEEIPLDKRNTDLRAVPDPRKTAEAAELWRIIRRTGTQIYTAGPFAPPVQSARRTSFFGDRRVYRYADGSSASAIHAGIDYGVPAGTPVRACAQGRVVLAQARIVTGNSVILEHLPGVYSLYYHLDTIAAAPGDLVERGAVLGASGATGLATGPHLHWEIRVSGENTDPDAFMTRPVLDKEAILSIFNSF
ncbi:MAG: M23 family metallopeptidase [Spirochaetaceae bacterium]|jgi:hypothetical protein|nr:M23 family metallopeptidase [Spirochaetaceae bacterium]